MIENLQERLKKLFEDEEKEVFEAWRSFVREYSEDDLHKFGILEGRIQQIESIKDRIYLWETESKRI